MNVSAYDRFSGDGLPDDDLLICDGCNVRWPHEHRCHGDQARVDGEPTEGPCECPDCRMSEGQEG